MWRTENLNSVQIRDMQRLVKTENYTHTPPQPRPPWSLMAHFYAKKGYKFTQFDWSKKHPDLLESHARWVVMAPLGLVEKDASEAIATQFQLDGAGLSSVSQQMLPGAPV